jgi:hypothetical protein
MFRGLYLLHKDLSFYKNFTGFIQNNQAAKSRHWLTVCAFPAPRRKSGNCMPALLLSTLPQPASSRSFVQAIYWLAGNTSTLLFRGS